MCTPSLAAAILNSSSPLTSYVAFISCIDVPIPDSQEHAHPLESCGYHVCELRYKQFQSGSRHIGSNRLRLLIVWNDCFIIATFYQAY